MAKDPVCGMEVEERGAMFTVHLEHETFYFCSSACRKRFEVEEGLVSEGYGKSWWRRRIERLLKEPAVKPPKCH